MAQIRSKQIKDFLTTVNWAEVSPTQIANTQDIKQYVDGRSSDLSQELDASIDSLEVALSAEIVATNSDVTEAGESIESIDTRVSLEENRVTAILDAVDANPDSFADVVSIINAVDTENDQDVVNVIASLNAEISATNLDFTSLNTRVSMDESNLSSEIVATNFDVNSLNTALQTEKDRAEGKEGSLESRLSLDEIALSSEIAITNSEVVSLSGRAGIAEASIDSLEIQLEGGTGALGESVDSLELALSAEIVATNTDFTNIATSIEARESVQDGEKVLAKNEHATETINLAVNLQQATTQLATQLATDTASVNSIEKALRVAVEGSLETRLSLEEVAHATELSAEAVLRVGADNTLQANIDAENARIDAILDAVDANPDSFADVVSIINAVDTENDQDVVNVIARLETEISATNLDFTSLNTRVSLEENALSAEIVSTDADVASIDTRLDGTSGNLDASVDSLELALSSEIVATNTDFTNIATSIEARESVQDVERILAKNEHATETIQLAVNLELATDNLAIQLATDTASANSIEKALRVAVEGSLETRLSLEEVAHVAELATEADLRAGADQALNLRVTELEGEILEDNEYFTQEFVGAGYAYSLTNPVQDNNMSLVDVFVNGHRVFVLSVTGSAIELKDPGYAIDAEDKVMFIYQA